ncbi:serine/threonine protein kinase, partial [Streptomyces sp. NPDC057654]
VAVVAALAVGGVFVAMSMNKSDEGGGGAKAGGQAQGDSGNGGNGGNGGNSNGSNGGGSGGGREHNGTGDSGTAQDGNGQGNGGGNHNGDGPGGSSDAGPDGKDASPVKQGDQTKTISKEKCTDAYGYFNDKKKKTAPDFKFVYINSAKDCLTAAGWRYRVEYTDEKTWGKGTVMSQTPANGDPFDPHSPSDQFVLTVSTGKAADGE